MTDHWNIQALISTRLPGTVLVPAYVFPANRSRAKGSANPISPAKHATPKRNPIQAHKRSKVASTVRPSDATLFHSPLGVSKTALGNISPTPFPSTKVHAAGFPNPGAACATAFAIKLSQGGTDVSDSLLAQRNPADHDRPQIKAYLRGFCD